MLDARGTEIGTHRY